MPHRRLLLVFLSVVILTASAAVSRAQVPGLDEGQFIEGLRRQDMNELLLYLLAHDQLSALERNEVEASVELVQADNVNLPYEERVQAIHKALDAQRRLIKENYDLPPRPIWQTDLAEMLLMNYPGVVAPRAAEYYEFGVPTTLQKEVFEKAAPEALEACVDADMRIFRLNSELGSSPDQKRYDTISFRQRLFKDYGQQSTPFFEAMAAYDTALLPDTVPYYQTLGKNPVIPAVSQKSTPAAERQRLLKLAEQKLSHFVSGRDINATLRASALCLTGRVQLAEGNYSAAVATLKQVTAEAGGDTTWLLAQFALAQAAQRQGQTDEFKKQIAALKSNALVKDDMGYRILLADLVYRSRMRQAKTLTGAAQAQALTAAFEPYQQLLNDRSLSAAQLADLKNYLYSRWQHSVGDVANPDALPTMVAMALGESYRFQGQRLMAQALGAPKPDAQSKAELAQGQATLKKAQAYLESAIKRPDVTPEQKAQAMYNLGVTVYYADPQNTDNLMQAIDTWLTLAQQMPDQPLAESAITDAMKLARRVHTMEPRPKGATALYERAFNLLTSKYPTSPAADNEYAYYAYAILQPAGKLQEAIQYYDKVPPTHAWYFDAQGEALSCLKKLYDEAPASQKAALAQRLAERASRVRSEIKDALAKNPDPEQAKSLKERDAYAALILVDLDADKPAQAIAILTGLEHDYADNPEVVRLALGKHIMALADLGQMDQAQALAQRMMAQYPDAAAAVVNDILTSLDQEVEQLRQQLATATLDRVRQELQQKIVNRSRAAELFARMLNQWAESKHFTDQQMLPIRVVLAKSLLLSGKATEALGVVKPLMANQAFSHDADLIAITAETYYQLGAPTSNQEQLSAAAKLYNQLIGGLKAQNGKYPPMWWQSWLRLLQIRDLLRINPQEIPGLVDRLKATDKDLGGPQFKPEFERLQRKNL